MMNPALRISLTLAATLLLCASGCDEDPVDANDTGTNSDTGADTGDTTTDVESDAALTGPMDGLYSAGVGEIVIEIDYQTGAAPFVSDGVLGSDPFELFVANAERIFAATQTTITVPNELSGMQELTDISNTDGFTVDEILAIADEHRDDASTDRRRTFYTVWLDGNFEDDSGIRANVLGVSLGNTGVIAMFKPSIDNTATSEQVEQVTLVHEFGHAIGMVNRGVPMVDDHHDVEHGAHCSNPDCVMFWTVEGSDIVGFIQGRLLGGTDVLFGPECLADFDAAAE